MESSIIICSWFFPHFGRWGAGWGLGALPVINVGSFSEVLALQGILVATTLGMTMSLREGSKFDKSPLRQAGRVSPTCHLVRWLVLRLELCGKGSG